MHHKAHKKKTIPQTPNSGGVAANAGLPGSKLLKGLECKGGLLGEKLSADVPFLVSELTLMEHSLPRASDTAKGLHAVGVSGTIHLRDAALCRWEQLDEAEKAMAEGRRLGNGNPFWCGIWPELEDWLKTKPRDPDDVYIFPELVFTRQQLKDPLCNKKRLSLKVEMSPGIRMRAWVVFHEFLLLCGITRKGVSFRSFRSYKVSELFAAGYPLPLLKAMTGHSKDETLFKYVHVLPRHVRRLAEFYRTHYLAAVAGKPLPVYLTLTEAVEALISEASQNQADLKSFVAHAMESLGSQIKNK